MAVAAAACGERAVATAPPARTAGVVTLDDASQQRAGIRIAAVETAPRAEETEAPGVIALDERRTARIGSLVEGIVLDTMAEVGDRVEVGQLLAAMHSTVVHETWASYRKAMAERRKMEKELAFAVAAHERVSGLYAQRAVSTQDMQRAEADRVAAEEGLDMIRTDIRRSEEALQHLGITNADDPTGESGEQIPVKTPMSGVVLERLVTPGTTVTPGAPLYVVSDLSVLWALVDIDESLLPHVRAGQTISVRVGAYADEAFAGTVTLVGDMVNPKTRRVTVRCEIKNPGGRLKPNMYATAILRQSEPRQAIVVPAAALQTVDGRPTVFVVDAEGRFRPRALDVGATSGGLTDVRSGLRAGERVAVEGSFVLKSELLKSAAPE